MKVKVVTLEERLLALQKRVERGETTLHDQVLQIPQILKEYGVPKEVIWEHSQAARDKVTRRHASNKEIMDAINWNPQGNGEKMPYQKANPKVVRNQQAIDIWTAQGNLESLRASSDKIPESPQSILRDLYAYDELLAISDALDRSPIRTCGEWCEEDLSKFSYICQSTLKDPKGGRNNANCQLQRWYVFETDDFPRLWNEQAGLIVRLSQELPLKCVVHSGNKSLHAYFKGDESHKVKKWFEIAKTLGGDPQVLDVRCQFVRLPWGYNTKTNSKQEVIFYRHG